MRITAVHYEGDSSSLTLGHHQNQGEEEGREKPASEANERQLEWNSFSVSS